MNKIIKYSWWVLIIALLLLAFWVYVSQNNQLKTKEVLKENQKTYDSIFSDKKYLERDYEKEFYCEYTSNVGHTECLIENLDRVSAIREWKQKKLEILKHPEVNKYNVSYLLSDEVEKIKEWRGGFEDSRNKGCIAGHSFREGSGLPGLITECELNYEISALKTLDELYYETILGYVFGSNGISDFEPTEKDIEKLVESNKTTRGCVWADDEACKYP